MTNVQRVRDLATLIEMAAMPKNQPRLGFNMRRFVSVSYHDNTGHNCGTTACIAGWAIAAFGTIRERKEILSGDGVYNPGKIAREILNLNDEQAIALFFANCNLSRSPQDAVEVLRRLADTGKVEW